MKTGQFRNLSKMAKPFFDEKWADLSAEELSRARAKLSGFIEATPDKDKLLRQVKSSNAFNHEYNLVADIDRDETRVDYIEKCRKSEKSALARGK